jgi:hypothetical protein
MKYLVDKSAIFEYWNNNLNITSTSIVEVSSLRSTFSPAAQ